MVGRCEIAKVNSNAIGASDHVANTIVQSQCCRKDSIFKFYCRIMSLSDPDLSSYKSIFNSETLVRKGLCPVSTIRRQKPAVESHSLYFEQHGNGPEKILFIMGCAT